MSAKFPRGGGSNHILSHPSNSSKIYLLIDGFKLENGILKEVGSNESDDFAC